MVTDNLYFIRAGGISLETTSGCNVNSLSRPREKKKEQHGSLYANIRVFPRILFSDQRHDFIRFNTFFS